MFLLKKDSEPESLFSSYSVASWANEMHSIHASMLETVTAPENHLCSLLTYISSLAWEQN